MVFFKSNVLYLFLILVLSFQIVSGDHFRYGSLSWITNNFPGNDYRLNVAFSLSYLQSKGLNPVVGGIYNYAETLIYFESFYVLGTSEYYNTIDYIITAIHPQKDLVICYWGATLSTNLNYPQFYAYWYAKNGARQSNLLNNAEETFRVTTNISYSTTAGVKSSPSCGVYPIVDMYQGISNTLQLVSVDSNRPINQLVYVTSPGTAMSTDGYSLSQPPGLSITSGGLITFNPPKIGLYNVGIRVNDYLDKTWCSLDFLINSRTYPTTPFPSFQSPTPSAGSINEFIVGQTNTINLYAISPIDSTTVSILVSGSPSGMVLGSQIGGNPATMVLSYNPPASSIGYHIMSLNLIDSQNVSLAGSYSFIIQVVLGQCGQGTSVCTGGNCICSCNVGWTGPKCNTCANNTYTPNCLIADQCVNGIANTGPSGDGKCLCNAGWTGRYCNSSLTVSCSLTQGSYIIGNTSNPLVSPGTVQAYLSPTVTPILQIPIIMPSTPDSINLLILLDETASSSLLTRYQQLKTNYYTLYSNLNRASLRYGLGKFSDSSTVINPFTMVTNGFQNDLNVEMSTIALSAGDPQAGYQYRAIAKAAQSAQWMQNSMRIIVLITDNNIEASNTDITLAADQLLNNNILFGVMGVDSISSYSTLLTKIGYGRSSPWTTTTAWVTTFSQDIFSKLLQDITIIKKSDTYGFISSLPNNSTSGVTQLSGSISIPTGATATNPFVKYQIVGYGYQTINIQFNHPPTTVPSTIHTFQGSSPSQFLIQAFDSDLNLLTVTFSQLPALGIISSSAGSISPNVPYSTTTQFTYTLIPGKSGNETINFVVSDGCSVSSNTISVVVISVNTPPTCSDIPISANQISNTTFTAQGIDQNGDSVFVQFPSLASVSLVGTLYTNNDQPIAQGQKYPSPLSLVFVPLSSASNGVVTFQYLVSDPSQTSSQCSVSLSIARTNTAPILQIQSSITTQPTITILIPFIFSDLDANDEISINVTSFTASGGQFFDSENTPIGFTPYNLGSYVINSQSLKESNISYTAPNTSPITASITIVLTDSAGLSTTQKIIISVVGSRPNAKPFATQVSPFYISQGNSTSYFYLNGTDSDPQDNVLTVVISNLPTNGQLFLENGTVASTTGQAPMKIKYTPNPTFYGQDSLTFNVQDTLGDSAAVPVTIFFYITHVNHAPVVSAPNVYANQYQDSLPVNIIASDFDEDGLVGIITVLPQYGFLAQSDGTLITSSITTVTNFSLSYIPPQSFFSSFNTSYSIKICDNYTVPLCTPATGNISFTYFNTPPVSYDISENCTQGKSVVINLNCTDVEGSLKGRFPTLPSHGTISLQNGTTITSNSTLTPLTIVYTPDPTQSDADTLGGLGPLETFFYICKDESNIESSTSTIHVYVDPAVAPTYTGPTELFVNEDSTLTIPIKATPGTNGNINVNLLEFNGGGSLQYISGGGSIVQNITTLPMNFSFTFQSNVFLFTPPQDYSGDNNTLVFYLYDGNITSSNITIHIDVTPVNDIPIVVPVSYTNNNQTFNFTNLISIDLNTSTVISWKDSDFDSSDSDIYGIVVLVPTVGTLYTFDFSDPNFMGKELSDGDRIERYTDGLFKVVYQPVFGEFKVDYTTFSIAVHDTYNVSISNQISINVKPINTPPIININTHFYEATPKKKVLIKNISVSDADANLSGANITIRIHVEGFNPKSSDSISLLTRPPQCQFNSYSLQCEDTPAKINTFIETIQVLINSYGNYTIYFVVNDLGLDFPGVQPLISQAQIVVNAKKPTATGNQVINKEGKKRNLALMIPLIVIGCLLVLLVIGFLVYKYIKRKRTITPPLTNAAFAGSFNISDNPMYKTATDTIKNNKKLRQSLANIN